MAKEELTLYALGYVVTDKAEDEHYIKVYPVSTIPTSSGELSIDEVVVTAATDFLEGNLNVVVNKSSTIECEWFNQGDSNRLTAPDVCKGEIVFVYNIHGQDKFWWDTAFTKPEYRKREKVLHFFSNKGEIDTEDYLSKGYFLLVDTRNKMIHLHTADNDGELTSYDISLNTLKGSLLITDGKSNSIELASHKDTLIINTNANVEVNTKNAIVNAATSTKVTTGKCTIISDFCEINP